MPWKGNLMSRGVRTVSHVVWAIRLKQSMDVSIQGHHAFPKQVRENLSGVRRVGTYRGSLERAFRCQGVNTRGVVQNWVVELHGDEMGIHTGLELLF